MIGRKGIGQFLSYHSLQSQTKILNILRQTILVNKNTTQYPHWIPYRCSFLDHLPDVFPWVILDKTLLAYPSSQEWTINKQSLNFRFLGKKINQNIRYFWNLIHSSPFSFYVHIIECLLLSPIIELLTLR